MSKLQALRQKQIKGGWRGPIFFIYSIILSTDRTSRVKCALGNWQNTRPKNFCELGSQNVQRIVYLIQIKHWLKGLKLLKFLSIIMMGRKVNWETWTWELFYPLPRRGHRVVSRVGFFESGSSSDQVRA